MTSTSNLRRRRRSPKTDALLGLLIPLVVIGLSIADFVRDGEVDKYLIGALMVFGLGALGYRIDSLFEKYLEARAGESASPPANSGRNGNAEAS